MKDIASGWETAFEHPNTYYLLIRVLMEFFEHFGGKNSQVERIYDSSSQMILENELKNQKLKEKDKPSVGVFSTIKSYTTDLIWSRFSSKNEEKDLKIDNKQNTNQIIEKNDQNEDKK